MNAKYLEVSGRTYYAFEEPEFIGPREVRQGVKSTLKTLESYKHPDDVGVFERQMSEKKFDWTFGVILPTVCFFFDPIVFSSQLASEKPILGGLKSFAFALSFVSILGLMASLLFGEKLKGANALLAGLFATAAGFSLFVGICIAPFSLLGLILIIGILGFTPLFTSFVYFRNAMHAFRMGGRYLDKVTLINALVLGALASAVIPYLINLF